MSDSSHSVIIASRGQESGELRESREWPGLWAERVTLGFNKAGYDFRWQGSTSYVALHDIRLLDGEVRLGYAETSHLLDLRHRLTLAPAGCEAAGWSELARRRNSFTTLCFQPDLLEQERDVDGLSPPIRPLLYFVDAGMEATIAKIGSALANPRSGDDLYLETACLLAVLEVSRMQRTESLAIPASGQLSLQQRNMLQDFLMEHFSDEISLTTLASLVGLSRFHFIRAFKATFGQPPYLYLRSMRVAQAKDLLRSDQPLAMVSKAVGFRNEDQFARAFKKVTGATPSQYRRSQE